MLNALNDNINKIMTNHIDLLRIDTIKIPVAIFTKNKIGNNMISNKRSGKNSEPNKMDNCVVRNNS
jgi:hypothetical protein